MSNFWKNYNRIIQKQMMEKYKYKKKLLLQKERIKILCNWYINIYTKKQPFKC